jgi:4-hydroxyproline epimerase
MQTIEVIDSHTGGEPTRLITAGFPDVGQGSMAERREILRSQHDAWRAAAVLEPRGNDVLVGALLCTPQDPTSAAGVIFFNNTGYLGMCGHGTIGLVVSLAYMGRIGVGTHTLETSVGKVQATLHEDGSVSVRNVPAMRHRHQVPLQVPSYGLVHGDVAWGGNWFFLASDHGQRVSSDNLAGLTAYSHALKDALVVQGITGADGAEIDHIELFGPDDSGADSRNFVLCPGGAYDRSPCGTGTSAKVACLAADGKLAPGEIWTQGSIIGSRFDASYALENGQVIPTIRGRAFISAKATLVLDPQDPFVWGIRL